MLAAEVGADTALVKTFTTDVTDGTISIQFSQTRQQPKINAIEIHSIGSGASPTAPVPSPTPAPVLSPTPAPVSSPTVGGGSTGTVVYRVNAGGGSYTDSEGQVWEAGAPYVSSGSSFTSTGTAIEGTDDDELFRSEIYFRPSDQPMKFEFNVVENGLFSVRLGFAEVYGLVTGERVFNVIVQGETVLSNHDIYAVAGANTADIETITTEVTDGLLIIEFEHVVENPKVSNLFAVQLAHGGVATFHAIPAHPTFSMIRR